jgi:hypothetical protein
MLLCDEPHPSEQRREGVDHANQLKASGGRHWFRGQGKDRLVQSTFLRVPAAQRDRTMQKLARFEGRVKSTPGLEKLAAEADATIAVARHYGLPTSRNLAAAVRPDIAAFAVAQWKEMVGSHVVLILQTAWTPSHAFDFSRLAPLFAREIAPYQVLARETAVFYSPARLDKLGLP